MARRKKERGVQQCESAHTHTHTILYCTYRKEDITCKMYSVYVTIVAGNLPTNDKAAINYVGLHCTYVVVVNAYGTLYVYNYTNCG